MSAELEPRQREESALQERLQSYERQAQEAEKELAAQSEIPPASMFNYKSPWKRQEKLLSARREAWQLKTLSHPITKSCKRKSLVYGEKWMS